MKNLLLFLYLITLLTACEEEFVPKPRGYFRIDLPKKEYKNYNDNCPFSFETPTYSNINPYSKEQQHYCWLNINYNRFKATLHLSYFPLKSDLSKHIEDARSLVYKHTVRANAIDEQVFSDPEHKKYGLVYNLEGNAASALQFYLTDSTSHFLRGALYFNVTPNPDSIAPVEKYIKADIYHLINTLQWK